MPCHTRTHIHPVAYEAQVQVQGEEARAAFLRGRVDNCQQQSWIGCRALLLLMLLIPVPCLPIWDVESTQHLPLPLHILIHTQTHAGYRDRPTNRSAPTRTPPNDGWRHEHEKTPEKQTTFMCPFLGKNKEACSSHLCLSVCLLGTDPFSSVRANHINQSTRANNPPKNTPCIYICSHTTQKSVGLNDNHQ